MTDPDGSHAIRSAIQRAYGSMLSTVSVEATTFAGIIDDGGVEQSGYFIQYSLVDCPTPVSIFAPGIAYTGIVPPITQGDDTPEGRDCLSPERTRTLLRAFGTRTGWPVAQVWGYSTAAFWSEGQETVAIDGKTYTTADLWVVTAGVRSQSEFRERFYHNYEIPGYIFWFPEDSSPVYVGVDWKLGAVVDVGD